MTLTYPDFKHTVIGRERGGLALLYSETEFVAPLRKFEGRKGMSPLNKPQKSPRMVTIPYVTQKPQNVTRIISEFGLDPPGHKILMGKIMGFFRCAGLSQNSPQAPGTERCTRAGRRCQLKNERNISLHIKYYSTYRNT